MKKWSIKSIQNKNSHNWAIKELVSCLLENRGLTDPSDIQNFLHPRLEDVTPEQVGLDSKNLQKALSRIKHAIQKKEQIVIYTDYDVDGICAGAILWDVLTRLGANVMPYVPRRVEEGYGLSVKGVDEIKKSFDPRLVITVDNGIAATDQVEYAKSLGIDVIITDHHHKGENPPKAFATIHTTHLAGSGVAWVLAHALLKEFGHNDIIDLDLVALATVADMVPLIGPNRTLVKHGLEALNTTNRVGLQALFEEAGIKPGRIGTYEIGHIVGPRINAMGRITHALDALRLLCTKNAERARTLAALLGSTNKERQLLTEESVVHARKLYEEELKITASTSKLIFIHDASYNQGVIGLIAGKLVEEYYKPAIVVSRGEEFSKASIRSISGFNIIEALHTCDDILVNCGGHPMAAGFTVETSKLELLKKRLHDLADATITEDLLLREVHIDCELDPVDISWELYEAMRQFEPFGLGNPQPTFVLRGITVYDVRLLGSGGKHIKLRFSENLACECIGFNMGQWYPQLYKGARIDIAFTVDKNSWNNTDTLQLKLKDITIPT